MSVLRVVSACVLGVALYGLAVVGATHWTLLLHRRIGWPHDLAELDALFIASVAVTAMSFAFQSLLRRRHNPPR